MGEQKKHLHNLCIELNNTVECMFERWRSGAITIDSIIDKTQLKRSERPTSEILEPFYASLLADLEEIRCLLAKCAQLQQKLESLFQLAQFSLERSFPTKWPSLRYLDQVTSIVTQLTDDLKTKSACVKSICHCTEQKEAVGLRSQWLSDEHFENDIRWRLGLILMGSGFCSSVESCLSTEIL